MRLGGSTKFRVAAAGTITDTAFYPTNPIIGDGSLVNMWRWQSLRDYQKDSSGRGGYGSGAIGGGTFGGVGAYAATVGGLWDAMLGEGRHFWLFASSDFHETGATSGPASTQKTYTYVADTHSPQAIVDGLRSGNTFIVSGDLIDALDFRAQYSSEKATMGETLPVVLKKGTGNPVKITDYKVDNNPTTKVIATFTAANWETDADGWHVIQYQARLDHDMYFRLRGTNLAPNTTNETDSYGNPLPDSLMGTNTPAKDWADLWFYSNPIFVRLQR